jgi:hypothetical protein
VTLECLCNLPALQLLSLNDFPFAVKIPDLRMAQPAAADHWETPPGWATQHPLRHPVDSTHMAAEKGRLDHYLAVGSHISNSNQVIQTPGGNPAGCRLEVLPGEKNPHHLKPGICQPAKILLHLSGIKILPPVHRLTCRPVINTQWKLQLPHSLPGSATPGSCTARKEPLRPPG